MFFAWSADSSDELRIIPFELSYPSWGAKGLAGLVRSDHLLNPLTLVCELAG